VHQNNTKHAIDPARTSGTSPPSDANELQLLLAFLEDFAAFAARRYLAGDLDELANEVDQGDQ
jgi:hypothetical protein